MARERLSAAALEVERADSSAHGVCAAAASEPGRARVRAQLDGGSNVFIVNSSEVEAFGLRAADVTISGVGTDNTLNAQHKVDVDVSFACGTALPAPGTVYAHLGTWAATVYQRAYGCGAI